MAQETVVVTTAGLSHTDDRKQRQRRYAMVQAFRITCFVLAVALPVPVWAKLSIVAVSFTLPWFGVVSANAAPLRPKDEANALVPRVVEERIAIEPGRVVDQD